MLTIKNRNKLVGKFLNKKKYYVSSIMEFEKVYQILLRSDKHNKASMIYLHREESNHEGYYRLLSSLKYDVFIHKKDINNMDILIDKLRLIGVE